MRGIHQKQACVTHTGMQHVINFDQYVSIDLRFLDLLSSPEQTDRIWDDLYGGH